MLRSLELFGFKSFADKTVFEFSTGITGVVGPNGSGKSNVVDSIKWILGDQSPRSLRGKEMTDVIFNGSSGRGPAQFAEATLVFDNRSGFLPADVDEVTIGRRLWQSGDSEYLINRNTARLKDIRDLFSGTGAGSAAYCIIEQGRVDQILQSNASNRRLIFEEAAGIARFKARRTEATRRLERVEQNLLRLTDIVDEVESQVGAVRSQAQRASRFHEVSSELEALWVGMVSDDYRRQKTVQQELAAQQDHASAMLEEMGDHRGQAEQRSRDAEIALNGIDEEIRTLESERAELRSRIASLETTLRHQSTRETELELELKRLSRQLAVMDGRVTEAEQEERHISRVFELEQAKLKENRAQQNAGTAQLNQQGDRLEQLQLNIESAREQVLQQVHENSALSSRMTALRSEQDAVVRRLGELNTSHEQQSDECARLREKLIQQIESRSAAADALRDAQDNASQIRADQESIAMQQLASRDSLAEQREQRSASLARRSVLEDLEERQEGFGIGVREILNRAETSTEPPWTLIRGSVADLLDVDMSQAALLEVALSGRAQLLVIDRMEPLVDYLSTGRCRINGRVGFVSLESAGPLPVSDDLSLSDSGRDSDAAGERNDPLRLPEFDLEWLDDIGTGAMAGEFSPELNVTWVDGQTNIPSRQSVFSPTETPSLTGQSGVIGRADSLARSPRHIPHLASLLLADTWVVKSLSDAVRIVQESKGTVRAVTPQGELVENDGTLHSGMVRSESAVLSRKSELRRLKNELNRTEHLIEERELQLQRLAGESEANDSHLAAARQAVAEATERCRGAEQDTAETQQSVTFSEQRIERLETQRKQLHEERESLDILRSTTSDKHRAGEIQLKEFHDNLEKQEAAATEGQQQLEELKQGRTEFSLELTRLEERTLSLQEAAIRLRDDLNERCLQQREAERRLSAGQSRVLDLTLAKLNVRAELAELCVNDDRMAAQVDAHGSTRELLRARRQEANERETEVREQYTSHERRYHELELQINEIKHQLKTAAERIEDEYQISVEEAVQQGRSALAVWLSQLTTVENAGDNDSSADEGSPSAVELTVDSPEVSAILHDAAQYAELRESVEQRIDRLRRQLRKIGNVGTESLENLVELETRFERLHSQLRDLEAARDTLRDMVRRINAECRRMFMESFSCIQEHFQEIFRRLFGGGEADLVLEDPDEVLDCSIDVVARPPGKELRSITLLSGGEKTLTAVALLLSIFRSRPSPFCLLDEVDAALDDANISRFVGVLKDFRDATQFIMITHRKPTMSVTDVLYGVTMEESGVSKRLSVCFEEIDERGNFITRHGGQSRAA
ncbi:MAG: AAA family ATPase [Fuerstiella sp.]|nr:AAA family ATPase [Fuerstiella sp.]